MESQVQSSSRSIGPPPVKRGLLVNTDLHRNLGISQIVLGVPCLPIQIGLILIQAEFAVVLHGIWGFIVLIVAGILGTMAAYKKVPGLVKATLATSIISASCGIIIGVVSCVAMSATPCGWEEGVDCLIPMILHACLVTLGILGGVTATVQAVSAGRALCHGEQMGTNEVLQSMTVERNSLMHPTNHNRRRPQLQQEPDLLTMNDGQGNLAFENHELPHMERHNDIHASSNDIKLQEQTIMKSLVSQIIPAEDNATFEDQHHPDVHYSPPFFKNKDGEKNPAFENHETPNIEIYNRTHAPWRNGKPEVHIAPKLFVGQGAGVDFDYILAGNHHLARPVSWGDQSQDQRPQVAGLGDGNSKAYTGLYRYGKFRRSSNRQSRNQPKRVSFTSNQKSGRRRSLKKRDSYRGEVRRTIRDSLNHDPAEELEYHPGLSPPLPYAGTRPFHHERESDL